MKYSKNFERDYEFYLRHIGRFRFAGGAQIPEPEFKEDGVSAKRAFHILDSQGKLVPTREPERLVDLIVTKKGINFHLKMWAEGYDDCLQGVWEYMGEFQDPPEWVEKAFRNQIAIHYERRRAKRLQDARNE